MTETYDIAIAGAGPAGLLCAARLAADDRGLNIAVFEKEPCVGGRLRSTSSQTKVWNYGLNQISEKLYRFWDQTLKADSDAPDLGDMSFADMGTCGVIAASQMQVIPQTELFSKKGARAVAGAAAARDWANLQALKESLDSGKRKEQAFQSAWTGTQKSPAAIALEHIAACMGIADLWSASTSVLFAKGEKLNAKAYIGDWDGALTPLLRDLAANEGSCIRTDAEIIGAAFDADQNNWRLTTRVGVFTARKLIVAMPPWDALRWLPKPNWPAELLQMTIKCKPVSAVMLSEVITERPEDVDIPERILVPSEGVQILVNPNGDICFQATIDFEVSLQAPDVVKAVRRLRRARKKLLASIDGLQTHGDHLALIPVGWSQPTSNIDRRWIEKMSRAAINTESLFFCGDAYGPHLDEDDNFIESLLAVCEQAVACSAEHQAARQQETTQEHDSANH